GDSALGGSKSGLLGSCGLAVVYGADAVCTACVVDCGALAVAGFGWAASQEAEGGAERQSAAYPRERGADGRTEAGRTAPDNAADDTAARRHARRATQRSREGCRRHRRGAGSNGCSKRCAYPGTDS